MKGRPWSVILVAYPSCPEGVWWHVRASRRVFLRHTLILSSLRYEVPMQRGDSAHQK